MDTVEYISYLWTNGQLIFLLLLSVLVVAIGVFVAATTHTRRLARAYRALLGDAGGKNAETLLLECVAKVDAFEKQLGETTNELLSLRTSVASHVQKVGLVRYDAFDDVGGEQSFSLALLDARGNGVVVSGLCGRDETRVYSKPISNGRSNHSLSTEEIRAIARAIEECPVD